MINMKKAGLLIALLVVPALIFLFLKGFGKNHFTLKKYYPLVDSTTGEIKTRTTDFYGQQRTDTLFHTIPDYQLIDQEGRQVTSAITKGKIYVAGFFFTRCQSICPKMSDQLSRVQEAFASNPAIVLVCHTVDPTNDTVGVLKVYASTYKALPGKWYFLTGRKQAIYDLAQKGYFISAMESSKPSQKLDDLFIHSEKLVLVDKDKHIRGYFNGTDPKDVDRLITEIQILLQEGAN